MIPLHDRQDQLEERLARIEYQLGLLLSVERWGTLPVPEMPAAHTTRLDVPQPAPGPHVVVMDDVEVPF